MRSVPAAALIAFASLAGAKEAARPDLSRVEVLVVSGTNDFRRDQGRGALGANAKLGAAARELAQFMARSGKYGHEADGRRPAERVQAHGYRYCMVAENISYQFSSAGFGTADLAARFLDGWKRSAGHRANMLDRDATQMGVAVARSAATGYYYAVQVFGRPTGGGHC